ncbi:cytokine receptor family member b1 [Silurus meridionalis]|nr:cytokine receptor family member b1 [Silurus meridionalis]
MLVLLLSFSAFASVPVPANYKVSSKNFIHILEWSPGNGTQPGTVYNVKINDHQERNIAGTYVDISKYMKDIHLTYKIQLWASFGSDSSAPVNINFKPSLEMAFLAFLIFGSLLVGLCILIPLFSLVYTGFLCKLNTRLPEALQNNDDGDDDDEDEEIQNPYMDRGAQAESESTLSDRSASVSEIAENAEQYRFEGALADAKELYSPFQLHSGGVKGSNQAALFDTKAVDHQNAEEKPGRQMKEKEDNAENDDSGNVNLWSVVLKSMQPEEDEADEAGQPLLPLFLKEFQEDSYAAATGSSFELHTLLIHTEFQASEDDNNDIPVAHEGDHVKKGYMASYTGNIDAGRCLSDDDDEDDEDTSGYMTR